ncbi:MAG: domain containing protein [Fibrobacteres bacterium]|nr:domain containing protein [Fibrobacterota bacterium]
MFILTPCLGALSSYGQSCPAATAADFKKETLVGSAVLKEPIELSVAKDGKVFVVQRNGDITLYNPSTGQATLAIHLDCYLNPGAYDVGGPLGVAVAPNFPTDNWVYIYYAPKSSFTGSANNTSGKLSYFLSRFRFVGGSLDANSEQKLFEVKAIWETHNGGSLKFGKDGDLYLSTGDNHSPGCSGQYSPMDERPGYSWCDDQGTTANTNELRGKVLRIHPEETLQANGKYYSIPKDNLKEKYAALWPTADLAAKVLPEIYTMGHRNPYRIFPDPVTGKLFIAENGPASASDADRGPAGADQWKVTDEAAYLGYPYFLKNNQPYCHWDYGQGKCIAIQGQTSMKFDANKPVNYSPNNTGVNILPPAKPAALWEHDGANPDPISGLKACGPGAGPVYHFDASLNSKVKFPPDFDNKWIFHAIMSAGWQPKLTNPPSDFAPITAATNPPWGNQNFTQGLHDLEYGLGDGALYAVDYGSSMYNKNGDAGLFKITYNGCLPPVTVSIFNRPAAGHAFLSMSGAGERLTAPVGARGATMFSLNGKKIWGTSLDRGATHIEVPASLGKGVFRVVWK